MRDWKDVATLIGIVALVIGGFYAVIKDEQKQRTRSVEFILKKIETIEARQWRWLETRGTDVDNDPTP